MSKTWKFIIGVIVVVVILVGLGMLRWSNRVYWSSNGERGWSLGATAYQAFGWGTENYLSDFGRGPAFVRGDGPEQGGRRGPIVFTEEGTAQVEVTLVDDDGDGVPDRGVIDLPPRGAFSPSGPAPQAHSGRAFGPGVKHFGPEYGDFGRRPPVGGFLFLLLLVAAIGGGIYFYRRQRAKQPATPDNTQSES
jgi:hypothetical protein